MVLLAKNQLSVSVAGFLLLFTIGIIMFESFATEEPADSVVTRTVHGKVSGVQFGPTKTFPEMAEYFQNLAREKGGVHAFDVMVASTLPPNIDTHLLGHVVGDMLYEQEGIDGMSMCTHDFRNACSHSIVIGALLEHGISVFDEINEVCANAPGDSGLSYNMCFHGFGHGVLSYTDYDLEAAVELCERTGTPEHHYYEFNECVGGVIMEIHDGIHDRQAWERNALQFIDYEEPANLCEHDFIPNSVKDICYVYLTPFIFDLYAAGEFPTDKHITQSFEYCGTIEDQSHRRSCYGGIGKELPGLSQGRDVSMIQNMTQSELKAVHDRCALAFDREGYEVCNQYVLSSLYWGGESHFSFPASYCELVPDGDSRAECFTSLHRAVGYYLNPEDRDTRERYCDGYSDHIRSQCYDFFNL